MVSGIWRGSIVRMSTTKMNYKSNDRQYPFSQKYFEQMLKRLNSRNDTIQNNAIIAKNHMRALQIGNRKYETTSTTGLYVNDLPFEERRKQAQNDTRYFWNMNQPNVQNTDSSENFEVLRTLNTSFEDVGGYDLVKEELSQSVDMLKNYEKYSLFNVRIPKGLIFEGPPGNGKTLLAKSFAGECGTGFISVSGSDFQEKYVGVGSSRVKELFSLAKKNKPCVIFIDEIDAVGRTRSNGGETSSSERDSTLNQLLVQMDGFNTSDGVFVVGATNRADLLDPALIRPGRIDKRVFIGMPDNKTRSEIINIHLQGKPHDTTINKEDLCDITSGMSGAQIENMLNEAMLYSLRDKRFVMNMHDVEYSINRAMSGWQPNEHQFSDDMLKRITIHEMGHAMVGLLVKKHNKLMKIVINLSSPKTPGYTVFEGSISSMYTRESLLEHLMILLSGRIAEEMFYNVSVTTGAINDFEEALKLAQKMVVYYGMGESLIYPSNSEKSKAEIDEQVLSLIHNAYDAAYAVLDNCRDMIYDCSVLLQSQKVLKRDELFELMWNKYPSVLQLYNEPI